MTKAKTYFAITLTTLSIALSSCVKDMGKIDKPAVVPPGAVDTCKTNIKYSLQITPIINKSCAISGCHVSGFQRDFSSYTVLKGWLDNGSNKTTFFNRIKPGGGMPPSGSISSCELQKMEAWLNDGCPQN